MSRSLRFAISAVLTCVALGEVGCARRETPVEQGVRTQTLLLGNGAEPADLDPQVVTIYTDQNIMMALFEGLTAIDETSSRAVPAAAERWEVSPDGLVWTFHLRPNLQWSNGEPLTADDFVQSWRRILTPAFAAEYSYLLFAVKNAEAFTRGEIKDSATLGFTAPDARTVVLTLARPTPYLPTLVAQPPWFPVNPRVLAKFNAQATRGTAWTRPGNHVGNGPFLLKSWSPNAQLRVERNPHYWDAAHTHLQAIVFFPIENPEVEERSFRAGQLHLTASIPLAKIATHRQRDPSQLRSDPFLQTAFIRFNVTRSPFDDPRLRRALALAIDREALARTVLNGSRPPAFSFTPPGTGGYSSRAQVKTDVAAARQLLAEAGHANGSGLPAFELLVRSDELQPKVAEALQAMWQRELGVRVTIAAVEQKIWIQNQQTLNYTISSATWAGDFLDPVTFLDLFVTGGGTNWTGWGNAGYDRLIAEAARTTDPVPRENAFQQAETLLLQESPITSLYFGAQNYLIHPSVKNWDPALLGFHRYQRVELQ